VLLFAFQRIWLKDNVKVTPVKIYHKSTSRSDDSTMSGVSGHVFSGERIRTFAQNQRLKNPSRNSLNTTSSCSKWAVVTTINAPTLSIHKVVEQSEFCVVIVADRKTPTKEYLDLESERVYFLSVEKQEAMQNMEIISELPWNHFGRKNLGYLYAIQHSAEVVFDFDDDNELISNIPSSSENSNWLVADNTQVFNPYPTFVELTDVAWPRGFPLTQIQNISTWKPPSLSTTSVKIGVIQSLANHDPDMDAIWRLTRKLPLNFDEGKRVVMPPGTYSSYNAQATLHYALWGMLLPVSVHGRVSDIWRSYIMQRLMHDVGLVVGFVSPFVKQVRNAHNYHGDYMSERPLYEKTEALVQLLSEWTGQSQKFEERFVELFVEMYERDFIEVKDVHLAQKWIRTLQQLNYRFPKILNTTIDKTPISTGSKSIEQDCSRTDCLRDIWTPPVTYCYKNGNDWSECAGNHLLYRPSTRKQLLSRRFMCFKEPFCWLQLDWKNTDPPEWSCHVQNKLQFYDMSYHDTVMASAATTIEQSLNSISKTNHEVFLCNCRHASTAIRNYSYPFKVCPKHPDRCETRLRPQINDYVNNKHFQNTDALIFGFPASMFEDWINSNKTLVLALWHIANQNKCTKISSQKLFDNIRRLASDAISNHIIGANTLYHLEYIRHFTGIEPIYLPATMISAINGLTYSQQRPEFLWNSHEIPPAHPSIKLVRASHRGRYELVDLTKYMGVVLFPYSITNGKSAEQYAMNIPMFAPTVEFAKTIINDRTATYWPYCPDMTSAMHPNKHVDSPYEYNPNVRIDTNGISAERDIKFWISFGEIYQWPCIKYFDSFEHMFHLLQTSNLIKMSACMKQANKWRHFEELQNLCWVTEYIN